jgi:HK97 family phage major capsid protein
MSRLATLKASFEDAKSAIEKIERSATEANRDLTDDEQTDVDTLYARAAELKPQIEAEAAKVQNVSDVTSILAKVNGHVAPASVTRASAEPMTAGEFLSNALKVQAGLMSQDEHIARAGLYINRAQMKLSDNTGIVPTPIVGSLINLYDATRPVWNSFTSQPLPGSGSSFTRPRITQKVATGNQAAEFDAVSSQKMTITGSTVNKFTEAGYLDLSQQDIDWTDPSALQLVINDFAEVYSNRMESRAAAFLVTTASASSGWTATNVSTIVSSVTAGVQAVYNSAKRMPDTLWLSLDEALSLAGTVTADYNRTAMAMVNEALAQAGINVNVVVGPQLANDTRILGVSGLIESYESINGLLQAAQPDLLGQRVAYSGYGALFGVSSGFVKLV